MITVLAAAESVALDRRFDEPDANGFTRRYLSFSLSTAGYGGIVTSLARSLVGDLEKWVESFEYTRTPSNSARDIRYRSRSIQILAFLNKAKTVHPDVLGAMTDAHSTSIRPDGILLSLIRLLDERPDLIDMIIKTISDLLRWFGADWDDGETAEFDDYIECLESVVGQGNCSEESVALIRRILDIRSEDWGF